MRDRDLRRMLLAAFLGACALIASSGIAASSSATYRLTKVTSVDRPTDVTSRTGDTGLYISEQDGTVLRFDTRTGKKTRALDIGELTEASGERGLLGLAFHPNGRFLYVNYTDSDGDTVVARYPMRRNTAVTAGHRILFTLDQPYANHNGGGLAFGPEGRLYIGTGDGGSRDDPQRRALDPKSYLGKIISIDPLANGPKTADPRIWSVGLRNPWRFEFDSDMNLWVADVGQDKWEEVDVAWAKDGSGRGANFGWSAYEGNARYNTDQSVTNHHAPAYVYTHGDDGCSISGGTRVRSASLSSLRDWYVFGDYCSGHMTALKIVGNKTVSVVRLLDNAGSVTAVRSMANGDVYALNLDGDVSRLVAVP